MMEKPNKKMVVTYSFLVENLDKIHNEQKIVEFFPKEK